MRQCGAASAQDLTDEQLLAFFVNGNDSARNELSAHIIIAGKLLNYPIDRPKALSMMRRAFKEDKDFKICYIWGEGVVTDNEPSYGTTHIEYTLKEKPKE